MNAPERISATPAAQAAISRLRAARGTPVMFVQSGGCCAGSAPMCFPQGEFVVADGDVQLGEIDDSPFYIDAALDAAWQHASFVLDVAPGAPEGFSLPAGDGEKHFIVRSGRCTVPTGTAEPALSPTST